MFGYVWDFFARKIYITGVLKIWNARTATCVHSGTAAAAEDEDAEADAQHTIVQASLHAALDVIVVVTFDHNITFYSTDTLQPKKHVSLLH